MRILLLTLTIALIPLPALPAASQIQPVRRPLKIGTVTPSANRVPRYERLELQVYLDATYDNPFDPDDVRLDAVFTTPSGKRLAVRKRGPAPSANRKLS